MSRERPLEKHLALALAMRLRDRREAVGLTQERVAELAGMSRNHYQLLESGLSDRAKKTPANPRLSTLADLSKALDCPVPELVDIFHPGPGEPGFEYEGHAPSSADDA
ncbi:helix-turn-helix domain-containing protein [Antribacter gilvus]|uniref:helix-turn-helix domain-containing protein n=1 Tax=Antribacter gilvus TaxID=2304675 RepID=UPI00197F2E99|nr:helix-turn-helix transcriptional regulator [Antribacter gilvus]